MNRLFSILALVSAFLFSDFALAAPTADQVNLLNKNMGSVAFKVQLGTLISNAYTAAPADGSVVTDTLGADAVTNAKLADTAVSVENLDSGITFTHRVVAGGTFTTAGGDAAETITAAAVVGTDLVLCGLKTAGASPVTLVSCTAGTGSIAVVLSADPSTDHVLYYVVWRAAT